MVLERVQIVAAAHFTAIYSAAQRVAIPHLGWFQVAPSDVAHGSIQQVAGRVQARV